MSFVATPSGPPPSDDLSSARQSLRLMRRIRWVGVVFALLQFALYKPPDGLTLPFPRWPAAFAIAAALVIVNLGALYAERRLDVKGVRRFGGFAIAADSCITLAVTWLFGFDHASALWALLIIPVLEGAVQAQMRGALLTWGVLAVGYTLRDLYSASVYPNVVFELESITYRMGIALIVAGTAGSLARNLTLQAQAHQEAKLESEQRARLLHEVAATSRALLAAQHGDPMTVWEAILDSAIEIGFDGGSINAFDAEGDSFEVVCARGLPEDYIHRRLPPGIGLAGQVRAADATVVVEDYSALHTSSPDLRHLQFGAAIAAPIRDGAGNVHAVLVVAYNRTGEVSPSEVEFVELLAAHGATALANVERQVEKHEYEQRLVELAYRDPLTRVPNREYFMQRLDEAIARGGRSATDVAVLFMDIDRFKSVNDSLGHEAGDNLLAVVARRLDEALRSTDLVARFGGDEFTVLLENVPDEAHAIAIAGRLLDAVRPAVSLGTREIYPTLSIGVALSRQGATVSAELMRNADVAMYRAKERGRDRIAVFHPDLTLDALHRLEMEAELRWALEREEFELHYQPIMALGDGTLTGVEALLRWHHPEHGFRAPADFIPLAEETGVIVPIGRWVLAEACRQVAAWNTGSADPIGVSVNLSVKQLQQPDLVADIAAVLEQTGLPAELLMLEITESVIVTDFADVLAKAEAIAALGVHLALDDFGRGFTSLSYLRDLPISRLKVDRVFVDGLDEDPGNQAIIHSMVQLAHALDIAVTAEGIETQAQLEQVALHGCDEGQGYFLCRPVPAAELVAFRATLEAQAANVVDLNEANV